MRVAFATCASVPQGTPDDRAAAELLVADVRIWDDPAVDWAAYDRVVLRSTWDYTRRPAAFRAWCAERGGALRNPPGMVAWSADKRYLADLADAGLPVVPTRFVAPGEDPAPLPGACVVKPAVSAGARRTGRFGPDRAADARALVARITAAGDTALVQPFLAGVAAQGETTLVLLGGALSHVVRKRLVLVEEGEAPLDTSGRRAGAAAVMYEPDLVAPSVAGEAQRAVGERVLAWLRATFGTPVYARVDLLPGPGGEPLVGEVELVEPSLHLRLAPGAARRFADAVLRS